MNRQQKGIAWILVAGTLPTVVVYIMIAITATFFPDIMCSGCPPVPFELLSPRGITILTGWILLGLSILHLPLGVLGGFYLVVTSSK